VVSMELRPISLAVDVSGLQLEILIRPRKGTSQDVRGAMLLLQDLLAKIDAWAANVGEKG